MFIYVLCEVATVSQLCISFPYVLHGLCEHYLTCDIAFNAVMPLSRASTRGRYSRLGGVTVDEVRRRLAGDSSILHHAFILIFIALWAVITRYVTMLMPILSYFTRFTRRGRMPVAGILGWKRRKY